MHQLFFYSAGFISGRLKNTVNPFLISLLLIFALSLQGFSQGRITGIVQESNGSPLPFVNVLLLHVQDSSLVKGSVSSETGAYSFENISAGPYLVSASMVGFKQAYSSPFAVKQKGEVIQLKALILEEDATQLNEVMVMAQKPLFDQQMDRMVVNVQSSIMAAGSTVLDILERSPGISVDRQNNALSMSGKQGVVVLVNGKPSRLPMQAVLQMLSGMNVGNIEKIELINTPSSSYDAEGNAGVINIVLKKNTEYGTNGSYSLTMGYGRFEKPAATITLNHRTSKLNIYGDYSFLRNHLWQQAFNSRNVTFQNQLTHTSSVSDREAVQLNHNARLGMDYTLSPKTTIGGVIAGFNNKWDMDAQNDVLIREPSSSTSIGVKNREINHWKHLMGNLNFRYQFSHNQQFSLDLDYLYYQNSNPSQYVNTYAGENNESEEQVEAQKITPIRMWVAKADYVKSIGKQSRIEAGVKGTLSRLQNDVSVAHMEQEVSIPDTGLSGEFDLAEDIGAAYVNVHHQLNARTRLQAGLRWEYTHTDLTSRTGEQILKRRYNNLFASVFISREINKNNHMQFSYSRRISRPTYNDLAPFIIFIDPLTFFSGNTALQPAITDALQLGYTYKDKYLFSLQYSYENNAIASWQTRVDPQTNKQFSFPDNVNSLQTYAFTVNVPVRVTYWWQMQHNLQGIWQQVNTSFQGAAIRKNGQYAQFTTTQSFSLPHNISAELSAFYQSPSLMGIGKRKAFGYVNAGVQKKFGQDKGTFRLSVDDIFWMMSLGFVNKEPGLNLDQQFEFFSEPRVVRLTYTRNFGNKQVKASKRRATGSEEDRKRVSN